MIFIIIIIIIVVVVVVAVIIIIIILILYITMADHDILETDRARFLKKKKKWRPEFGSKSSPTLGVFLPFSQILFISFFLKSHTMIAYNNV